MSSLLVAIQSRESVFEYILLNLDFEKISLAFFRRHTFLLNLKSSKGFFCKKFLPY